MSLGQHNTHSQAHLGLAEWQLGREGTRQAFSFYRSYSAGVKQGFQAGLPFSQDHQGDFHLEHRGLQLRVWMGV